MVIPFILELNDKKKYLGQSLVITDIIDHSPLIDWFDDMFQNLSPFTNDRNPWFQEYWQETYKCRIPGAKVTHYNNTCTG
jgi:hypothetical protein